MLGRPYLEGDRVMCTWRQYDDLHLSYEEMMEHGGGPLPGDSFTVIMSFWKVNRREDRVEWHLLLYNDRGKEVPAEDYFKGIDEGDVPGEFPPVPGEEEIQDSLAERMKRIRDARSDPQTFTAPIEGFTRIKGKEIPGYVTDFISSL